MRKKKIQTKEWHCLLNAKLKEKSQKNVYWHTHVQFSCIAEFHVANFKNKVFVDIKKYTHHIVMNSVQNDYKKAHPNQVHHRLKWHLRLLDFQFVCDVEKSSRHR